MAVVTQLDHEQMAIAAHGIREHIDGMNTAFHLIVQTANDLREAGMVGEAGDAMNARVEETNHHVQQINELATDKADAIDHFIAADEDLQKRRSGVFMNGGH